MLSRKSVIYIKRMILFGKRMFVMPYDWNHSTKEVSMGSLKHKFMLNLCTLYLYMEAFYQAWVLYAEFGGEDMPFQSYILISYFCSRLIGTTVTSLAFKNARTKKYFINQILYLNRQLEVYENGQQKHHPYGKLLRFAMAFIMFQPLILAFNYVGENTDKRYWHGALLPSAIQPFFIPLFFVVEYWISVVALSGTVLTLMFIVCYFGCSPRWIRLLIEKEAEVNENPVDEHDTYIYYRAQQILNQVYNNSYSFIWGFGMVCVLIDMVITFVCTIRITPNAEFSNGVVFPVGLLALLLVATKVFDPATDVTSASQDFIGYHRRTGGMEKMRRLRSLRPLRMKAWIFFSMSKSATPAFLNQTVDYSVSVLLMT